ncbi:MAG: 30S ribosomal protein S20 [Myxococcales bacterium]|nr:30S ribosomal protein S20 [Myxococcales bacterium]
MAQHKSAIKRIRQNEKRRVANRLVRQSTRTAVKKVRAAIASGSKDEAKTLLREAVSKLSRAGAKGVFPAGRVNRLISRLSKAVDQVSA